MSSRKANCGARARAGVPGSRITFSGVGKTAREMALALDENILCFNVESEPELHLLAAIAAAKGRRAPVALRVNPDIDAKTHHKIATGKAENKFGIPISRARDVYREAAALAGIEVTGVDMHIGSQITDLAAVRRGLRAASPISWPCCAPTGTRSTMSISAAASAFPIARARIPDSYHPERYAEIVRKHADALGCRLVFEPGRLIVGNAGILVTEVLYVKAGDAKTFVIVDAAMNDLVRPTLYDAHHEVKPVVAPPPGGPRIVADVVGPVCETGDYLALGRDLPARRGRRSPRHHVGRRLWGGPGRHL